MANYLEYKILPEKFLIVEYYEGQIELNDLIDFQIRKMNDKSFNAIYNIITDMRNSEFIVYKDDVKKFAKFIKEAVEKEDNRKIAIITNAPNQTAISMLYSVYIEELPLKNKVFTTLDAAMKWIGIEAADWHLIIQTLDSLKNSRCV